MVRLKDIAARAGVSLMTASKALGDATDVAAKTRARVRLLAQQMGYVPDSMAQGLRSRKSRLLGLVLSTVANPIFARTISAVEEGAHEWGYDLILAHTLNNPEREEACIRRLIARRVDGLLIFPIYRLAPAAAIYEVLWQRQTPTVILGQRAPFCAPADAPWAQERLEGYRRALREAQIQPDDRLIFTAGATMEEGEKAALQMLNESVSMTAIQAANDLAAMGAANVFLQQGLRIPGDLSIGGFGNILMSEHFRVPLTTVRQPKMRLGAAAMEIMQKLLRGEPAESRRLAAALLIRASTAAPKA
jgi:DNA-binding LacI/PurR family transcriptional regulator